MASPRQDLADEFGNVWERFRLCMTGLSEEEWRWQPSPEDRPKISWRLEQIGDLLWDERNGAWLGVAVEHRMRRVHSTAHDALADIEAGYEHVVAILDRVTDDSITEEVGPVAGIYCRANRFTVALHLLGYFIHHTAEAAVLRDLYRTRPR